MNIWRSKVISEDGIEFPMYGPRRWRWTFDITLTSISLNKEVQFKGDNWRMCHPYYNISLTHFFALGRYHQYYDGPNCSFSLGFIHFNWGRYFCKKCEKTC